MIIIVTLHVGEEKEFCELFGSSIPSTILPDQSLPDVAISESLTASNGGSVHARSCKMNDHDGGAAARQSVIGQRRLRTW